MTGVNTGHGLETHKRRRAAYVEPTSKRVGVDASGQEEFKESVQTMAKIAKALGVSIEELVK